MYAVRPDGTLQWTFRAGDRILSSALVDAGSAILFGSQDDRLYALEANGHLRWSVELCGDIDSSPVAGPRRHHLRGRRRPQAVRPSLNSIAERKRETRLMDIIEDDSPTRVVTGRIKVHPDGYAFVVPDDQGPKTST